LTAATQEGTSASARFLLILSAASFGGAWVAAPWATEDLPPLVVATLRFAIAAVLLFAWCRWRGVPVGVRREDLPVILGVTATSVVIYNFTFLYGVTLAPASHGAVIVPGLIPIATFTIARGLYGERIARRRMVGAIVCLVGLGLVVGPAFSGDSNVLAGDALFAGGALVWATYTILGRAATRRFHVAAVTFLSAALGAITLGVLSTLLEPGGFGTIVGASAQALVGVGYLATIGTVVSFVFYYLGVQRMGASRASAFSVLIPLFGVSLTVILLGERLEAVGAVGAALVLVGLWLTQAPNAATGGPAPSGGQ
jgi:drug/metabolite transporter (DMT)-like permease